jgi:hypothetical protein
MKVWDVDVWIVSSKKDPDYWEHWSTVTVSAETIEYAIQKAIEYHKEFKFYKIEARKAELVREVDVE